MTRHLCLMLFFNGAMGTFRPLMGGRWMKQMLFYGSTIAN